jgi:hypothetical protein
MGSKQLSGFPLHTVLSGVLTFFDRDGPTVSKISHWLRMSCRISERLPECKRVQRVIGRCILVSISERLHEGSTSSQSSELEAGFPMARIRNVGNGWRPMCGGDITNGFRCKIQLFSIYTDADFFLIRCVFKIFFVFLLSELFDIKPTKNTEKYVGIY